MISQ
jgi:hypothetical protein